MAGALGGGEHRPVILGDLRQIEFMLRQFFTDTHEVLMGLQEQLAALTAVVNSVRDGQTAQSAQLDELQASVDAEQEQVNAAVGLLTQDNPDLAAAISLLNDVNTNLGTASDRIGTIKADVESTIPDAPAPAPSDGTETPPASGEPTP